MTDEQHPADRADAAAQKHGDEVISFAAGLAEGLRISIGGDWGKYAAGQMYDYVVRRLLQETSWERDA